jgi:hypothetical protein
MCSLRSGEQEKMKDNDVLEQCTCIWTGRLYIATDIFHSIAIKQSVDCGVLALVVGQVLVLAGGRATAVTTPILEARLIFL